MRSRDDHGGGDSPKRAAVVAYTEYETDGRVRREAEVLVAAGYEVIALVVGERASEHPSAAGTVRVHEIPLRIHRGGYVRYAYQYAVFFLLSSWVLLRLHLKYSFSVVHVHSLPDFEVFSALPLRLMRTPVILDLHEALPEILAARFELSPKSLLFRVAVFLEQASCKFATQVIAANDAIRDVVANRGTPACRIVTIYNAPELPSHLPTADIVRKKYGLPDRRLLVHSGGLNPERDLETLLRAAALLPEKLSCGVVFVGRGENEYIQGLHRLCEALGVSNRVWFLGRLTGDEALAVSSLSEIGVVTLASNPLTQIAWPSRIPEFVALEKPLVVPDLAFLRRVMGASVRYYTPGDPLSLAREIQETMLATDSLSKSASGVAHTIGPLDSLKMRQLLLNTFRRVAEA